MVFIKIQLLLNVVFIRSMIILIKAYILIIYILRVITTVKMSIFPFLSGSKIKKTLCTNTLIVPLMR